MKNIKKLFILGAIILVVVIFLFYVNWKPWMLSIYRDDLTIMRIDYQSKDACLSAGRSYIADNSAERFDCGYRCSLFNKDNLQESPLCKIICNDAGCR